MSETFKPKLLVADDETVIANTADGTTGGEKSTGGIRRDCFFPGSLKDIDSVTAEVARDIRHQYAITYHSPMASAGGYHSVKIEAHASEHGRLTVHTRLGYLGIGEQRNRKLA